ncbi:MAG: iron-containing alcohol dehydrogenase [Verrucomicrobia bacterium]|nr:iron-containing alcohol dehydrogenase [Verrucomicrobiota bacterium]MBI3869724.1 iron-containing alcohol dehydrogenase [Verrucomicrobiota bacterium]
MSISIPATLTGEKLLSFEFATAGRIFFGGGVIKEAGPLARQLGSRALVVTGKDARRSAILDPILAASHIDVRRFALQGEPTVPEVVEAALQAKESLCDVVIGFGGGSAMDGAKAVAALMANSGDPMDYLEVIGRGQPLTHPSAPCITIPTTAGTGAEVTRNAVLAAPTHEVKVSLRSPWMLPRAAIVDPHLTHDLPQSLTATIGLDALTQLIEPYVCNRANPMTDGFCLDGLRRVARSLEKACSHPNDAAAREDMALASLLSGLALANAGLGGVHGFAGPIGGAFKAPHGAVCAALLPTVMEANIQALRLRFPNSVSLARFRYISRLLLGKEEVSADASVAWVRELTHKLDLPRLRDFGVRHEHFSALIEKAAQSSSMKANPVVLTMAELKGILDRAW